MPKFGPIKRQDLICYLKQLGFVNPTQDGKHQQMKKGAITLTLPNPHQGDIGKELHIQNFETSQRHPRGMGESLAIRSYLLVYFVCMGIAAIKN